MSNVIHVLLGAFVLLALALIYLILLRKLSSKPESELSSGEFNCSAKKSEDFLRILNLKRLPHMKTKHLLVFGLLFAAFCNTSFAMISVGDVSKEQADDLGIELRARPSGPMHAWIELEFKPEGKLAKFQHVSLEIADDDQLALGWTPLKDKRTSSGSVVVRVMGSRKFLEKITLRIVCGDFGDSGLDVKIKDFVDFEKLPKTENSNGSENAEQGGAGQPATRPESK